MSNTFSSSSTSRLSSADQFSLCIEGLPPTYTWRDLKDLVRIKAEHGIRADIVDRTDASGRKAVVGWARVGRRDEARGLFDWLAAARVGGRHLVVHMFDTSDVPPKMIACNCTRLNKPCVLRQGGQDQANTSGKGAAGRVMSSIPSSSYGNSVGATTYREVPMNNLQTGTVGAEHLQALQESFAKIAIQAPHITPEKIGELWRAKVQQIQQVSAEASVPIYSSAASGPPVNITNGFARTEARGIFVQGIDFKTHAKEIEKLFVKAGSIKKCELQKDSKGKSKGTAIVQYASAAEAQSAVQIFDGWRWSGRTLKVRIDKQAVVVNPPAVSDSDCTVYDSQEPTIVDGSGRRGKI